MEKVAPTRIIQSPSNDNLSAGVWIKPIKSGEIKAVTTITSKYRSPRGMAYKNRAFFPEELIDIIELSILVLKEVSDTPLSPHLLNYLAELEAKRASK